ncbi:M14 family zinc carboxypeptidase [Metabacillus endolithicus]|uniref:M14 family zinc carboxypeptidase n=1 Tax=Metabacillus endolithicus TaxID=1535204 RepID=A0ABW5BXH9_9BACI
MRTKQLSTFFFLFTLVVLFALPESTSAASYVNNNQVYTYEIMEQDIKELAQAYPDLISYKVIGKSEYGRNIYAVSLGKGTSVVQVNGSHHAREWMTTMVNMNMIDQYANAYKNGSSYHGYNVRSILNNSKIWFVPMVNPDGVTLQQFGLKKFPSSDHAAIKKMNDGSMDFRRWKANAKGIDLNRQYDADWNNICCSPGRPYFKNYPGPRANYAKETITMVDFTNKTKPEMVVSYHSSGEILYWDFHQTGSWYDRDHALAKYIGKTTGYSLVYPKGYQSGGGLTDWFISHYKRPAFTIEISPYVGETSVPLSYFSSIWNENKTIGLYAANEGHKLFLTKYNPVKAAATKKVNDAFLASKSLRPYHTSNLKTTADIKATTSFISLYNKTGSLIKTAEQSLPGLTKSDRDFLSQYIVEAKSRKLDAARFIDAVYVGDQLLEQKGRFASLINQNKIDDNFVVQYNAMSSSINKAEQVMSRIYGSQYRQLTRDKYISPSKIARESVIYEVSRYNLLKIIEKELNNEQLEQIEERFAVLERLEDRSVQIKEAGNKLYPGKYPDHPEIEEQLVTLRDSLIQQYKEIVGIDETVFFQEIEQLYADYESLTTISSDLSILDSIYHAEEQVTFIDESSLDAESKVLYDEAIIKLSELSTFKEVVLLGEEILVLQGEIEAGQSDEQKLALVNEKQQLFVEKISILVNESIKQLLQETYSIQ